MSNRLYDILKWICLIGLPAGISFAGVLLNVFEVEKAEMILTIAVAFNTFLGSVLGISNVNYIRTAELRKETTNGMGDDEDV